MQLVKSQVSKTKSLKLSKRTFVDPITGAIAISVPALIGGTMSLRYKVSGPNEYLVRTGLLIEDIKVSKTGFLWPFQEYSYITMNPKSYSFDIHSMSLEKLEFFLPCVFTIGPKNDPESLVKFARFLGGLKSDNGNSEMHDYIKNITKDMKADAVANIIRTLDNIMNSQNVRSNLNDIILGVLEGEVRILAPKMPIEDLFNARQAFKETIIEKCQEEMDKLGLYIYNANIKELEDVKGSNYFANMRQKKLSQAENKAKIDIAEANKEGNIGAKERDAVTRQQIAILEAETISKENEMKQKILLSNAEVSVTDSIANQKKEIAKIESSQNSRMKETEMQQEVEKKRIIMETEKLRATAMSKSCVDAEALIKTTDGQAEAIKIKAEADLIAKQKNADAILYTKLKEADAILAVCNAQSEGMDKLIKTFGKDFNAMVQYLMIDTKTYEKLAKTNSDAIQGLNPKITVWNTNSNNENSNNYSNVIADVLKMLPPMLTTIHDQTGIKPSDNLISMPKLSTKE